MYVQDPEGNVVEAWDYFERGRRVDGLAESQGEESRSAAARPAI
jgi:hypothetical protein